MKLTTQCRSCGQKNQAAVHLAHEAKCAKCGMHLGLTTEKVDALLRSNGLDPAKARAESAAGSPPDTTSFSDLFDQHRARRRDDAYEHMAAAFQPVTCRSCGRTNLGTPERCKGCGLPMKKP